ncbi:MAG: FtsX-like permease family protein [Candidatus Bathyarchaeia archaeon]
MRLTHMCLRNLTRRKLRTTLCISGVALATMFIVAVGATTTRYVAVIKEMNTFFQGKILVVAQNTIVIQILPIGSSLQENLVNEVKKVNGTKTAVPMLFIVDPDLQGVIRPIPMNLTIGIPLGNWSILVGKTPLREGGWWPTTNHNEIVVGNSIADQYSFKAGTKVNIKGHNLTVAGVMNTPYAILSRSILMPLNLTQEIYHRGSPFVSMIVVEPEKGISEKELAERIENKVEGVNALTENERSDIIAPILNDVESWNVIVQGVLFFLSMMLILLVSLMNVSERRRDFATLDALGAPKNFVLRMILMETALIGLFGSLFGLMFGTLAALFIASFYTNIPMSLFLPAVFDIISPPFIIKILVSTLALSCIAGVLPAVTASKTRIVEVLRAEY